MLSFKEKFEFESLEKDMPALNQERYALNEKIASDFIGYRIIFSMKKRDFDLDLNTYYLILSWEDLAYLDFVDFKRLSDARRSHWIQIIEL